MKLKVWFNHEISAGASEIQALLQHEASLSPANRIISEIHSAHCDLDFSGSTAIHKRTVEPAESCPDQYLAWALAYTKTHGINCLVLGQRYEMLIGHASAFRSIGVELLFSCSLKELAIVDFKPDFYHRLEQAFYADMVPFWKVWNGEYRTTLEDSIASARKRGCKVCLKPACRLEAPEFFTCRDPEQTFGSLPAGCCVTPVAIVEGKHDWLVMEYLPGLEYEVDCLAWKGQLRGHHPVALKSDGQTSDKGTITPDLVRHLQVLAREFGLNGMFRATFRKDADGRFKVLGVNPRVGEGAKLSVVRKGSLIWDWLNLVGSEHREWLAADQSSMSEWHPASRRPAVNQTAASYRHEGSYAVC